LDLKYHVIWITKYRYEVWRGRIAERARDLIRQVCEAREVVIVPGSREPGPHPHAAVGASASVAGQAGAVHQGAIVAEAARGVSGVAQAVLGATSVGAGLLLRDVGAVDEAMIKAYIENQKWDEDDQGFKITAPTEP
jgi:putative transposase